ncbi:hypothetical protein RHMOL_Rhmol03G0119100 [Rhododendron molle]|uniref:Uncharacterized protein n=1 Tax=Rhododendron molle TaxID=49168 RepID=A0ACC0PEF5_RHOML|nr:hypothetical protein RHMOL_Rhmol03G0119100 [Rhododendron molle]
MTILRRRENSKVGGVAYYHSVGNIPNATEGEHVLAVCPSPVKATGKAIKGQTHMLQSGEKQVEISINARETTRLTKKKREHCKMVQIEFIGARVHVYNTEELILCALPYHDTHVFVRIASPSKKFYDFYPSKAVISFCTVVEVLGSLTTLDDDGVKRVLPYVLSGLQLDAKGGLDLKFLLYTKLNIRKQYKTVFFEARCVLRMLKCNPRMMVDGSMDEILCRILDGNLDLSIDISDSKIKIWFALEHPKRKICYVMLQYQSICMLCYNSSKHMLHQLIHVFGALNLSWVWFVSCSSCVLGNPCYGEWFKAADWTANEGISSSSVVWTSLQGSFLATRNVNFYVATGPEFMLYATCGPMLIFVFSLLLDVSRFNALYDACYQVLVTEWNVLKSVGLVSAEESGLVKLLIIWFCYVISSPKTRMVDGDCKGFLDQLFEANFDTNFRQLNSKILVCLFWRILEVFVSTMPADVSLGCRVIKFSTCVSVAVQVESLHCFVFLCSLLNESLHFELLGEFPSLLVPLSSDNKDLRVAAMSCIEGLCTLSPHVDYTKWKSASDKDVLPSFLTTLLSSSCHSLLVPETIGQRFSSSIVSCSTVVRILDSVFEQEVCTIGSPYGKKKKKKKHMSHLNQNSGRTGKNEISSLSSLPDFFAAEERFEEQWNSDSQRVFEVLISAIVPCWLSKNGSIDTLLKLIQQTEIGTCGVQSFKELLVAMQFISEKLLDPEITFKLSSGEESNDVQALGLLLETVKDSDTTKLNHGRKGLTLKSSSWVHVDDCAVESFGEMCLEIVKLVDDSLDDSSTSLKVAALSAIQTMWLSSSCIRRTGALISVLGPRAFPELPSIMENVMSRSHIVSLFVSAITNYGEDSSSTLSTSSKEPLFTSILLAFEAVIDKLDGFLNPYLGDILKLMVLNPKFVLGSDPKLKLKADVVRKLITEKITVKYLCQIRCFVFIFSSTSLEVLLLLGGVTADAAFSGSQLKG